MNILKRLQARGHRRLDDLINKHGGYYTSEYVAERMEMPLDEVHQCIKERTILCAFDDRDKLPVFQFDFPVGGLVFGLTPLLEHHCIWDWSSHELIKFFLTRHDPSNSDLRPIDLMAHGQVNKVYDLIDVYYSQCP